MIPLAPNATIHDMRQLWCPPRSGIWLVFTPFMVALVLLALMALYPFSGIGPANNTFALCALAAIVVGLVLGVIALFSAKRLKAWLRLVVAVLYLPTVLFSLLLAGF